MTAAVLVCMVALLAVSFWRPLRRVRGALGVERLVASGYAFLVIGIAIGVVFDVTSGATGERLLARDLRPIIAFGAGWVGFAAGIRFERRVLAAVPRAAFARALAPAFAAAIAVGGAGVAVFLYADAPLLDVKAGALILAAAAASAGPTLAAVLRTRRPRRSREAMSVLRMIEFSAGIADGLVVALALLAFALIPAASGPFAPLLILALSVGGGVVLGGALWLFLRDGASADERLLLGLGMLAMIAGLGGWLEVAPAAVAAVAGVTLVNLPGGHGVVLIGAVRRVERPVVVTLMVVIGIHVGGGVTWHVPLLIAALTALRLVARVIAAGRPRAAIAGAANLATPSAWTLGLVPQGILGLVVALSFFHVWHSEIARAVLVASALAALINELIGPWLLLGVVRRAASAREGER